jgi:hypothetical protein
MNTIQAIGAPFNIMWSSCGTRTPKTFNWTTENNEIKVYMDSHLTHGLDGKKTNKKFGWFCESRIVKYDLFNDIKNNLNKYRDSYRKIFTCDSELISLDPNFFIYCFAGSNLPWTPENEYGIHNKNKKISFLCSPNSMSEGHRYRLSWAEKLKNVVDLYGGACGSKKIGVTGKEHYHHKRKTEAVNNYFYSIAFENVKYDTYFTEKITDCFANGVIPIYYGTSKISNYFDANGIIFLDETFNVNNLTEDLYYSKLQSVKNNLEAVKQLEMSDDMVFRLIKEII